MFIMYTCVGAVAVVASAFIKQRHLSTEHTETKTGIQQLTERVVGGGGEIKNTPGSSYWGLLNRRSPKISDFAWATALR
jgi:hypothetical protein